jgi:hypothetical protein
MPRIPPTAVRMMEEKDKKLAPQRVGKKPPIVEPINKKSQMRDFEFISK